MLSRKDRKKPAGATVDPHAKPRLGTRWSRFVLRRPLAVLTVAVLGLGAVAVPATSLELGLPDEGTSAPDSTQRKAYDMLSESFGAGFNGPLMVTVSKDADVAAAARTVGDRLAEVEGVAAVTAPAANKAGDTAIVDVRPEDRAE
ncbi:MMPL family transporter OS=Streptomyces alboniger OX=132473 GN=CP975_01470 PE=4 SV=1 [Streptomyces alboniger]